MRWRATVRSSCSTIAGSPPRTESRARPGVWGRANADGYVGLRLIASPTLVVNGSNDIVIATVNSFILQQHIPDAKLVLYPDSNHGAHDQFHDDFVAQVKLFLDRPRE
jgi:pimeloyl-ACP methyl ester carboxylesterase